MSRSALAAGVQYLRDVAALQQHREESDEQLLRAFVDHGDETAFTALVRRHGPIVLGVCRRILGHQQDAEDAFQAAFLVLSRRAASLRDRSTLAGFLHRTAYHFARKIQRTAGRRRKHEGQAPARAVSDPAEELLWREVRMLLDEEIARLPDRCRSVFILCCLENLSQEEAGRRLGQKQRMVSNRLAEARRLLQGRLSRRGVELPVVLATVAMASPSASALPLVPLARLATASPVVAALAQNTSQILNLGKVKLTAALLLAVVTSGSLVGWYQRAGGRLAAATEQQPQAVSLPPASKKTVTIQGRVFAPDGKPATAARVHLVPPFGPDEKVLAEGTTDNDGRFSLSPARADLANPQTKIPLRSARLVATAKGYGPDWRDVPLADAGKETTMRLVKDDVPIRGRILSLEGKPLVGSKVSVHSIEAFPKEDLTAALQAVRKGSWFNEVTEVRRILHLVSSFSPSATTDADGRFRLDGIGRERIATLHVEGPRIHYSSLKAMTRTGESVSYPNKLNTIYGSPFEYLAKPSRLIRGTVRERGSGKPLAGIRVSGIRSTAVTTTDARGHYELHGCPKGDHYAVMAFPRGKPYFTASVSVPDTEGLDPLTVDLEMVRGIPCGGKVLDGQTGKPALGHVSYYPLHPNHIPANIGPSAGGAGRTRIVGPSSGCTVEADGSFHCVVLPGQGCLTFKAEEQHRYVTACVNPGAIKSYASQDTLLISLGDGFWTGMTQEGFQAIELLDPAKDSKAISVTIHVDPAKQLKGIILDPDGKPLAGTRVRGLETSYSTSTLSSEKFTIHGLNPRRPRRLYFVHPARRLIGTLEVDVKGTETKPLTVRLQPWCGVRGRLLDADGQPIRNAVLRSNEYLPEEVRTDGEGRFRLEGLVPGRSYDLTYEKGKQLAGGTLLKSVIGKPGEIRDLGDVRTKPGG